MIVAAAELSTFPTSTFTAPRSNGHITPQTLFRGFTAEDVIGPYVSQLLLSPMNYGPYFMDGTMSMYVPSLDYLTDPVSWLKVQNGQGPFGQNTVDPQPRHIRNGRDFAMYVHSDPTGGLFMSFYYFGWFSRTDRCLAIFIPSCGINCLDATGDDKYKIFRLCCAIYLPETT
jgi:hypothetical protein